MKISKADIEDIASKFFEDMVYTAAIHYAMKQKQICNDCKITGIAWQLCSKHRIHKRTVTTILTKLFRKLFFIRIRDFLRPLWQEMGALIESTALNIDDYVALKERMKDYRDFEAPIIYEGFLEKLPIEKEFFDAFQVPNKRLKVKGSGKDMKIKMYETMNDPDDDLEITLFD